LANGRPTDIEYKPLDAPVSGECPESGAASAQSSEIPTVEIVVKDADVAHRFVMMRRRS
jgi:hypothetical protein